MADRELVPCVGGPLHGTERPWMTARFLIVPDAADMLHVMYDDGETMTLFGEHTYELTCFLMGGKERHMFRHIGYKKPTCPRNAKEVVMEWCVTDAR